MLKGCKGRSAGHEPRRHGGLAEAKDRYAAPPPIQNVCWGCSRLSQCVTFEIDFFFCLFIVTFKVLIPVAKHSPVLKIPRSSASVLVADCVCVYLCALTCCAGHTSHSGDPLIRDIHCRLSTDHRPPLAPLRAAGEEGRLNMNIQNYQTCLC